jgi:lauroyl/myristoyl acyltransferase
LGVWELLPALLFPELSAASLAETRVVYRPLHTRMMDRWVLARRARAGARFLPDKGSFGELREALLRGGLVCLLSDMRPSSFHYQVSDEACNEASNEKSHEANNEESHEASNEDSSEENLLLNPSRRSKQPARAPLLGRAALWDDGAGALHSHTGAPVWFVALLLERHPQVNDCGGGSQRGDFRFRLRIQRLVGRTEAPAPAAATAAVVDAYAAAVDAAVRESPEQYFWWHRRWRDAGEDG